MNLFTETSLFVLPWAMDGGSCACLCVVSKGRRRPRPIMVFSVNLEDFPDELWERILHSATLSAKDLCSASQVSSKLRDLISSKRLWKAKFQQSKDDNLTQRYYGAQLSRYLSQKLVAEEMKAWTLNPRSLEKAFMLGSWFQTSERLSFLDLSSFLDKMAADVIVHLAQRRPRHPILTAQLCTEDDLEESWWKGDECRSVLESLSFVFAVSYGFTGNSEDYYNPNNSFINKVIETRKGIPMTLSVIYQAVAKRLGVRCQLINFPSHMLIKFLEHPDLDEAERYTFIDAFVDPQRLMNQQEVFQAKARIFHGSHAIPRDSSLFAAATHLQVIRRMWNNLSRVDERHMAVTRDTLSSAYKLGVILCPIDVHVRFMLSRHFLHMGINFQQVIELMEGLTVAEGNPIVESQRQVYLDAARDALEHLTLTIPNPGVSPKDRLELPHVNWSVGQIMKHRKYGYRCVIHGWDERCEAGEAWIKQMGVRNGDLVRADNQPFYKVLVADGTNRYAAEDNLVKGDPGQVTHPEVGKYFDKFCGSYYRMNPEKQAEYPRDLEAAFHYAMEHHADITLL